MFATASEVPSPKNHVTLATPSASVLFAVNVGVSGAFPDNGEIIAEIAGGGFAEGAETSIVTDFVD